MFAPSPGKRPESQRTRWSLHALVSLGLFGLVSVATLLAVETPADFEHARLMFYRDAAGREQPVRTPADWQIRRKQIVAGMAAGDGRSARPDQPGYSHGRSRGGSQRAQVHPANAEDRGRRSAQRAGLFLSAQRSVRRRPIAGDHWPCIKRRHRARNRSTDRTKSIPTSATAASWPSGATSCWLPIIPLSATIPAIFPTLGSPRERSWACSIISAASTGWSRATTSTPAGSARSAIRWAGTTRCFWPPGTTGSKPRFPAAAGIPFTTTFPASSAIGGRIGSCPASAASSARIRAGCRSIFMKWWRLSRRVLSCRSRPCTTTISTWTESAWGLPRRRRFTNYFRLAIACKSAIPTPPTAFPTPSGKPPMLFSINS